MERQEPEEIALNGHPELSSQQPAALLYPENTNGEKATNVKINVLAQKLE